MALEFERRYFDRRLVPAWRSSEIARMTNKMCMYALRYGQNQASGRDLRPSVSPLSRCTSIDKGYG